MDINTLRSAVTVISALLFIAIVVWTWSSARRSAFEEAAALALLDDRTEGDCQ
jgi:cytochrome c oxidase cbb3-type subunit IV